MKYLKHNLCYLQSISDGAELYPVIKANAYGHGFKQVAQEIDKSDIKGVCIATINELQDLIDLNPDFPYNNDILTLTDDWSKQVVWDKGRVIMLFLYGMSLLMDL